ncbi:MAG: hypothetical protein PVJ53_00230 [Desulfobacterales bacterium]|jgi:hypothetical protein
MTRKTVKIDPIKSLAISLILILAIFGCGNSSDLPLEVSGKYKSEQGSDVMDIQLTKEVASLTINGQTFKGIVEFIDRGTNTVHVKVETDDGKTEVWSIHEVWNDNGSAFNLNLRRNGTTETLIPVGNS